MGGKCGAEPALQSENDSQMPPKLLEYVNVEPSLEVTVDPSPPVIAAAEIGFELEVGEAAPPVAVGLELGEPDCWLVADLWWFGFTTTKMIGRTIARTTITKAKRPRKMKRPLRFDFCTGLVATG